MPTRRTVSLLIVTRPERSRSARQVQSPSRDSAGSVPTKIMGRFLSRGRPNDRRQTMKSWRRRRSEIKVTGQMLHFTANEQYLDRYTAFAEARAPLKHHAR